MPGLNDLRAVNPVETRFSIFIRNHGYAALRLMPPFMVDDYVGTFWKYDVADALVTTDLKRAADGTASELEWKPTTASYIAYEKAKRTWMSDRNEMHANEPVRPSHSATFRVTNQLLLGLEKEVAAIATSTSVLTQNVTLSLATQKYSDKLNSTPLDDFSAAILAMKYVPYAQSLNPGVGKLIAIMSPPVAEALRLHPDILGMFANQDGPLSLANLAEAMHVNEIVVADGLKDVAGTPTYIWNNDIVIAYVNDTRELDTMTFGFTPMVRMPGTAGLVGADGGLGSGDPAGAGIRVRDYREEQKGGGGGWREADAAWGQSVVLPQLAYLIKSAV